MRRTDSSGDEEEEEEEEDLSVTSDHGLQSDCMHGWRTLKRRKHSMRVLLRP